MVDIGNIIKEHCYSQHYSLITLAGQIDLSPSTLYKSLNSNSLSVQRLDQISRVLNHNFFIHFIENTGSSESQLLDLTNQNKELTAKVAALQNEITYLKEINALLNARNL